MRHGLQPFDEALFVSMDTGRKVRAEAYMEDEKWVYNSESHPLVEGVTVEDVAVDSIFKKVLGRRYYEASFRA